MKKIGAYWFPDVETQMIDEIEKTGGWHADRLHKALNHLTQKRTAIDVGAHVGTWTLILAKQFRQVLAFEPNPTAYDCLMMNLHDAEVKNVHAYQKGLGDHATYGMVRPDPKWGPGNTGGSYLEIPPYNGGAVPIARLDELWVYMENTGPVDFIKIDAEGMEAAVLLGAEKTIRDHKPLIIWEDKAKFRRRHNIDVSPHEVLESYGYQQIDAAKCDVIWRHVK